jgi:hypothetical protein
MVRSLKFHDQTAVDRSLLWAGAVLIGAGALLGLAGSALCGAAAALRLQNHVRASGMPPSELAMHHWRREDSSAGGHGRLARASAGAGSAPGDVPRLAVGHRRLSAVVA